MWGSSPMQVRHPLEAENLRGPVRRSYSGAMVLRQLPAAISRSAALSSNWASFSASAKVEGETGGPTSGAVPKAGGVPGGGASGSGEDLRHATVALMRAVAVWLRNCLRESDMFSPKDIVLGIWSGARSRTLLQSVQQNLAQVFRLPVRLRCSNGPESGERPRCIVRPAGMLVKICQPVPTLRELRIHTAHQ